MVVFWNISQYHFVYDDAMYLTNNVYFKSGLSADFITYAFTTIQGGSYHPLVWLSWVGDYELYGLNAGGYHLTNLLIHICNTLLLFLFLRRATGNVFCSWFVAALFAIHPLHVESVAWVSARKDTLSTFFWMLTMGAYLSYTEHPDWRRYFAMTLFFVFGLMAKPMLVTLPFVLILLDYWPLKRMHFSKVEGLMMPLKLLWEKTPLILLSIGFSLLTIYTQNKVGALMSIDILPFSSRIMNAIVSYVTYIEKMFWPQGLAAFYPHRQFFMSEFLISGMLLIVITYFSLKHWRKHPYLIVGWLWYVVTLVPVIGFLQVGMQAMADRYTYVPMIGLFLMLSWGTVDLLQNRPYGKTATFVGSVSVIIILSICTLSQTRYWRDDVTLFSHALSISPNNQVAHSNLGVALKQMGNYKGASYHFQEAIRIKPSYAIAHDNLGRTYILQGRFDEGISHIREAFRIDPNHRRIQRSLADALVTKKEYSEAIDLYQKLLKQTSNDAELYNNLGVALAGQGRKKEAIMYFENALKLSPDYVQAKVNKDIVTRNSF